MAYTGVGLAPLTLRDLGLTLLLLAAAAVVYGAAVFGARVVCSARRRIMRRRGRALPGAVTPSWPVAPGLAVLQRGPDQPRRRPHDAVRRSGRISGSSPEIAVVCVDRGGRRRAASRDGNSGAVPRRSCCGTAR